MMPREKISQYHFVPSLSVGTKYSGYLLLINAAIAIAPSSIQPSDNPRQLTA